MLPRREVKGDAGALSRELEMFSVSMGCGFQGCVQLSEFTELVIKRATTENLIELGSWNWCMLLYVKYTSVNSVQKGGKIKGGEKAGDP